ncbi:hypothetical protein ANN_00549 [Periplaneta americana]|uniref:Uncharacterized protein n=1 Tax=Periplaneta americana TaxID=6978 RepID=A0ABQ8TS84_PERAM|nr:hypothetical protein ANN_00549 [Periplaneta americana]
MDLREVGYDDRDWINLAQDRDRWRAYWPYYKSPLFSVDYYDDDNDDNDDDVDDCVATNNKQGVNKTPLTVAIFHYWRPLHELVGQDPRLLGGGG